MQPVELGATDSAPLSRGARTAAVVAFGLLSAVMLALLAFLFLTEKHYVASTSMAPSLNVDEFAMFMPVALAGDPQVGDIVTFHREDTIWVKRLVAGPGDRISFSKGVLRLNGRDAALRPVQSAALKPLANGVSAASKVFEETLPNGRSHLIIDDPGSGSFDDMPEVTVPPAHYFLIGDNRDNSYDSRSERIGMIAHDALTAKDPMIYFSYDSTGLRFDRFGTWAR